jgi:hypothetical protein
LLKTHHDQTCCFIQAYPSIHRQNHKVWMKSGGEGKKEEEVKDNWPVWGSLDDSDQQ